MRGFTSNSEDTGITFPSSEGGTNGKITEATLTLTPTSKVNDSLYNFQIELRLIDSNKKVWTLSKELPIQAYFIDRVVGNEEEDMDPVWQTLIEKLGTKLDIVSADELNIYAVNGTKVDTAAGTEINIGKNGVGIFAEGYKQGTAQVFGNGELDIKNSGLIKSGTGSGAMMRWSLRWPAHRHRQPIHPERWQASRHWQTAEQASR